MKRSQASGPWKAKHAAIAPGTRTSPPRAAAEHGMRRARAPAGSRVRMSHAAAGTAAATDRRRSDDLLETPNAAPMTRPEAKPRIGVMRPDTATARAPNHATAHRSSVRNSVEQRKHG